MPSEESSSHRQASGHLREIFSRLDAVQSEIQAGRQAGAPRDPALEAQWHALYAEYSAAYDIWQGLIRDFLRRDLRTIVPTPPPEAGPTGESG
jgi:hypothetical protein